MRIDYYTQIPVFGTEKNYTVKLSLGKCEPKFYVFFNGSWKEIHSVRIEIAVMCEYLENRNRIAV